MTGYSPEELIAEKIYYSNITPPEYQELDAEKLECLQKNGFLCAVY
jgi:hypothetical protein